MQESGEVSKAAGAVVGSIGAADVQGNVSQQDRVTQARTGIADQQSGATGGATEHGANATNATLLSKEKMAALSNFSPALGGRMAEFAFGNADALDGSKEVKVGSHDVSQIQTEGFNAVSYADRSTTGVAADEAKAQLQAAFEKAGGNTFLSRLAGKNGQPLAPEDAAKLTDTLYSFWDENFQTFDYAKYLDFILSSYGGNAQDLLNDFATFQTVTSSLTGNYAAVGWTHAVAGMLEKNPEMVASMVKEANNLDSPENAAVKEYLEQFGILLESGKTALAEKSKTPPAGEAPSTTPDEPPEDTKEGDEPEAKDGSSPTQNENDSKSATAESVDVSKRVIVEGTFDKKEAGFANDTGDRPNNEDALLLKKSADGSILVAAIDGMGGHKKGEIASSIISDELNQHSDQDLDSTFRQAENRIFDIKDENGAPAKAGAAATAAKLSNSEIKLCHIGDTRAFLINSSGTEIRQLTEDHRGNEKHVLTRALGGSSEPDPDRPHKHDPVSSTETWGAGDVVALATDGVTNMVTLEEIRLAATNHPDDLQAAANEVIALAKKRKTGGEELDNLTIVFIKNTAKKTA